MDTTKLKAAELARWKACQVNPHLIPTIDAISQRLVAAKDRYRAVWSSTGVPWPIIAVIHERECSQSWLGSLAQGDPWNRVSVHVPRGRGPFASWEAAAIDALAHCPPYAAQNHDWSIGGALVLLEEYNGLGYARMGRPSPYLWASTDQYQSGKYIADGHYDPHAIDHQIGCSALLKRMMVLDSTVEWDGLDQAITDFINSPPKPIMREA
jgi:lysozyme family protein